MLAMPAGCCQLAAGPGGAGTLLALPGCLIEAIVGASQPSPSKTPPSARRSATAPPAPAVPTKVEGAAYRFVLPVGWSRDWESPREVYRDGSRHHAVRLDTHASALSESEWVDQQHPNATNVWDESIQDRTVTMMTKAGKKLRITAVVVSFQGAIYELSCSQEPPGAGPNSVCRAVLGTFRVWLE